MKILSFVLMLMLPIAPGLSEESHFEFPPENGSRSSVSSSVSKCHFSQASCSASEKALHDIYSHLLSLPSKEINYYRILLKYWDVLPKYWYEAIGKIHGQQSKRRTVSENSLLFMKLNELLNRKSDPGEADVPARYRRIGIRLGSEFLGKRSPPGAREPDRGPTARDRQQQSRRSAFGAPPSPDAGVKTIRKMGTELLGKRNVELLGKRGLEPFGGRSPASGGCGRARAEEPEAPARTGPTCAEFDYSPRRKSRNPPRGAVGVGCPTN